MQIRNYTGMKILELTFLEWFGVHRFRIEYYPGWTFNKNMWYRPKFESSYGFYGIWFWSFFIGWGAGI